jgi:hypothetical protein
VKCSVNGELREAFSARTLDAPTVQRDFSDEIKAASRAKFCRPRKQVEEMLQKWDESASAPPKKEEMVAEEKFEEPLI